MILLFVLVPGHTRYLKFVCIVRTWVALYAIVLIVSLLAPFSLSIGKLIISDMHFYWSELINHYYISLQIILSINKIY